MASQNVSELMKLLEYEPYHHPDKVFNEFIDKSKSFIKPIFRFLKKLDKIRENLNHRIEKYFRDNLLALLLMSKDSGKVLYSYVRDELVEPDLIGGFLTAIQNFGNEIFSKDSPIKELCYKDFRIKIEEEKYTRVVVILLNNPNEPIARSISEKMKDFLITFELIYRNQLKNWKGKLCFEETQQLFQEVFFDLK